MSNLHFYQSQYDTSTGYSRGMPGVSGTTTPRGGYGNGSGNTGQQLESTGLLAALGTGGYPDEAPLLEELGVNFGHVKMKTLIVLNPFGFIEQGIMDDSDLAGPILFCLLFGTFLLLSGKIQFGYIYGLALLGCVSLHTIFSLMATNSVPISRTASVLGYCLLPLVFMAGVGVIVSMDGYLGYALSSLAIAWCTYSASAMFVTVLQLSEMRLLVAYPCFLFYATFAVMTIFKA
ncbi:Yip1-domain-containing protein [Saitoella complicata NRRL Y-17804]|uniref:Yip1-domain-containing protein n=1 Tax=Saitoella complicata (strain BCRC 22490 / CBS 7301 / JCM 7358 / NBRC 10748 / NRRL Y-17804) TaxID=698492 RepID=UPI0008676A19|nr:Yip1-domain-containing protein [Saitoella complicata NRRL Y-17804]ODQ51834.1 Yip1-domain-containing protein [Saitoella complicata NRRL Y-17804]